MRTCDKPHTFPSLNTDFLTPKRSHTKWLVLCSPCVLSKEEQRIGKPVQTPIGVNDRVRFYMQDFWLQRRGPITIRQDCLSCRGPMA